MGLLGGSQVFLLIVAHDDRLLLAESACSDMTSQRTRDRDEAKTTVRGNKRQTTRKNAGLGDVVHVSRVINRSPVV